MGVATSPRKRVRAGLATAALVLVAAGGAYVGTTPATSTWTGFEATAFCACVIKDGDRYRAVFGYTNGSDTIGRYEAGPDNRVSGAPGTTVVTRFEPGTHAAAFASGWVARDDVVTWTVGAQRVVADWGKPACTPSVGLPAGRTGTGPAVALAVSPLVAAGAVVARRFPVRTGAL